MDVRDRRQADHQHVEGPGRDRGRRLARCDRHGRAPRWPSPPYRPAEWPRRHGPADPPGAAWTQSRSPRTRGPGAAAPCTPISGRCRSRSWRQNRPSTPTASSCTNVDVSTPAKAAACEHWYRHRTAVENIFRDSKHGAALRHLPSGYEQVNTAWMWASLIAAAVAAWLHQLTGLISRRRTAGRARHPRRQGDDRHPAADLIATPARLVRHGGQLIMRLAPGPHLLPPSSPRSALCQPQASRSQHHPAHRHSRHRQPDPRPRPPGPAPAERPQTREPGASPGLSSCPPARP